MGISNENSYANTALEIPWNAKVKTLFHVPVFYPITPHALISAQDGISEKYGYKLSYLYSLSALFLC